MKKCMVLLLIVVYGTAHGNDTGPTPCQHVMHIANAWEPRTNIQELTQSELEGIQNILNAFVNMIKGVAHAMANPNSKLAAWTGMTEIITNTFKVITELAKHKNHVIDDLMICDYERRGPHFHATLESMEHELIVEQAVQGDPTKQIIASNVANMIGNCANIIADHHNPHVVGSNVAHILSGIINIAVQLSKRSLLMQYMTYEEICAALIEDRLFMDDLSAILQHKISQVLLVRLSIK